MALPETSRLQAVGTETHPVAPFLPRHLHDRDVEGVGDVGRSGQVPAAVETLRVVVGPAHQHWLLRGGCQGKRKGNYLLEWAPHQVLNKGTTLHSQLLPDWEGRICKGSLACVYQMLERSGGLCPMPSAEVLHDT